MPPTRRSKDRLPSITPWVPALDLTCEPGMHNWKSIVELRRERRDDLKVSRAKVGPRRDASLARILLPAEDRSDDELAAVLHASRSTVERFYSAAVLEHGLQAALIEQPRPSPAPKSDERGQATLIALACSNPPG